MPTTNQNGHRDQFPATSEQPQVAAEVAANAGRNVELMVRVEQMQMKYRQLLTGLNNAAHL